MQSHYYVHSGNYTYNTATGLWAANHNPDYYTFDVHYKSSVDIPVFVSTDWQTAVISMWCGLKMLMLFLMTLNVILHQLH